MAIEDSNGDKVAELKKRVIGVVRDNFVVKIRGDRDWRELFISVLMILAVIGYWVLTCLCFVYTEVHGSILEHDFKIKEGGRSIVTVHKNWIAPIKDAYFIDIDEDCDDEGLAVMVVIGLESLTEEWGWIGRISIVDRGLGVTWLKVDVLAKGGSERHMLVLSY